LLLHGRFERWLLLRGRARCPAEARRLR